MAEIRNRPTAVTTANGVPSEPVGTPDGGILLPDGSIIEPHPPSARDICTRSHHATLDVMLNMETRTFVYCDSNGHRLRNDNPPANRRLWGKRYVPTCPTIHPSNCHVDACGVRNVTTWSLFFPIFFPFWARCHLARCQSARIWHITCTPDPAPLFVLPLPFPSSSTGSWRTRMRPMRKAWTVSLGPMRRVQVPLALPECAPTARQTAA